MIESCATVESCEHGRVRLRTARPEGGCGRCHEPGGCGGLRQSDLIPEQIIELQSNLPFVAGERVRLHIEDSRALSGALLSYGVALALLLIGGVLGSLWPASSDAQRDVAVLLGGVLGLVISLLSLRGLERSAHWRQHLKIEIRRDLV